MKHFNAVFMTSLLIHLHGLKKSS